MMKLRVIFIFLPLLLFMIPGCAGSPPSSLHRKQQRTLYTDTMIQNARRNIDTYAWAAEIRDRSVAAAEPYAGAGMEFLWNSVTGQEVPRSYTVGNDTGCPVCKTEIYGQFGNYPWILDPVGDPGKLTCPVCGGRYPSEEYPDDGTGYIAPDGSKYLFTAYYNHWGVWYTAKGMGPNIVMGGLEALREAYLYTGDARYARCGLAILHRVAEVYPSLDVSVYRWDDGYYNSHGMSGLGKAVGSIWESLMVPHMLRAYDAFFDVCDDRELLAFLSKKDPEIKKGAHLRRHIEEGIVLQVVPAVRSGQIEGNEGMHQNCAALAAVVLDSLPESRQWLQETINGVTPEGGTNPSGILPLLLSRVCRDGLGSEAAPGYNSLWLRQFSAIAETLEGYVIDGVSFDLYQNPKYLKMLKAFLPLTTPDGYTPTIGDSGSPGARGSMYSVDDCVKNFIRTGDERFARLAVRLNGGTAEGLHGGIFDEDPASAAEGIRMAVAAPETPPAGSMLAGHGFASLAAAEGGLWTYFGNTGNHGHRDTLNLGMYAFGMDIMPDLGYPEYADASPQRTQWISNTVSHNTVVVNDQGQAKHNGGTVHLYDNRHPVKLVEASSGGAYPHLYLEDYRRLCLLVPAGEDFYVLDLFRVKGGERHLFSLHAAGDTASVAGVSMQRQQGGTFAGPGISYAKQYDVSDPWPYNESGYHFLENVERSGPVNGVVEVDFPISASRHPASREGSPHLRVSLSAGLKPFHSRTESHPADRVIPSVTATFWAKAASTPGRATRRLFR